MQGYKLGGLLYPEEPILKEVKWVKDITTNWELNNKIRHAINNIVDTVIFDACYVYTDTAWEKRKRFWRRDI